MGRKKTREFLVTWHGYPLDDVVDAQAWWAHETLVRICKDACVKLCVRAMSSVCNPVNTRPRTVLEWVFYVYNTEAQCH